MKEILLSKGKSALVDDEDFDELSKYKWHIDTGGYARRNEYTKSSYYGSKNHKSKVLKMHRVIMNTPKGMDTDHINRNKLDNRKTNLRVCTRLENSRNRHIHKNNTSGYKGVTWHKHRKKWIAQIKLNWKNMVLGYFDTKEDAYNAYCEASKKYHGDYSNV